MTHPILPFQVLLIAGIDAVGLARFPCLLHNAGCRVTLFAPPGLAAIRSRYVATHIPCSSHPQQRAEEIKQLLTAKSQDFDWVILGDEPTLNTLYQFRGQNWLDGWFPVDHRSAAIDIIQSKLLFYQVANSAGILMPFSTICTNWDEVVAAVAVAGYPVILKTAVGLSGSGVLKVHDFQELESAYTDFAGNDQNILVQRFYDGPIVSTDVLFDHGLPVCWQSSYSLKCWPNSLASSSARQLIQHPEIKDVLIKIGQIVGFHGFAGVDWVHDLADNHLYILELNPRPTPTYHLDRFSGVSFSRSLNQLLSGQRPVKPTEPVCEAGKLIRLFPQNLYWGISNRECRSFILCWQDAPWDDFFLLIAYLRRFLTHFLPKSWVQKVKSLIRKPA